MDLNAFKTLMLKLKTYKANSIQWRNITFFPYQMRFSCTNFYFEQVNLLVYPVERLVLRPGDVPYVVGHVPQVHDHSAHLHTHGHIQIEKGR